MRFHSLLGTLLIAALPFAHRAEAQAPRQFAFGTVAARIDRKVLDMVRDPTLPRIYATTTGNTVIVVNTETLVIDAEIPVGVQPRGLDVSADGKWLYVANSGSVIHQISVIDLATLKVARMMSTTEEPLDVAASNGKLFILTRQSLQQIDESTGDIQADSNVPKPAPPGGGMPKPPDTSDPPEGYQKTAFILPGPEIVRTGFDRNTVGAAGPARIDVWVYGGLIRMSPDRKTLYYGNTGVSPDTLYRIDVSGLAPKVLQKVSLGSNGIDLTVSPGGDAVCYMAGSGNHGYGVSMLPARDIAGQIANFPTGPYPCNGAFSADGNWFYSAPMSQKTVKIYDVKKGIQTLSFKTPNREFGHLLCDRTGSFLFACNGVNTSVNDLKPLIVFSVRQ